MIVFVCGLQRFVRYLPEDPEWPLGRPCGAPNCLGRVQHMEIGQYVHICCVPVCRVSSKEVSKCRKCGFVEARLANISHTGRGAFASRRRGYNAVHTTGENTNVEMSSSGYQDNPAPESEVTTTTTTAAATAADSDDGLVLDELKLDEDEDETKEKSEFEML
mmetsp:Transcript_28708/g.44102  ORF Transcript_28708/g.44102 Transcript_28708/m.44102 type:complete len:162 (-) Transcript_28708:246-731(-)